ncbi:MAG: BsuPI-related putative proteinase inhibitor [Bryobacteraceae bacterium]
MRQISWTACAALFLLPAGLWGGDLLPLQTGNTWTYRDVVTGEEFTVRVGTPTETNDQIYYSLQGYATQRILVRYNAQKNLVYLNQDTGGENLLTSFEPFEGGWWQAPWRSCDQEGQTKEQYSRHDGPAGPFEDAVQLEYRSYGCADTGLLSEQYVDNIGMVRRVVSTIAGPRTFDLTYARVGRAVIDGQQTGQFSVTLTPGLTAETLTATLRFRSSRGIGMAVRFPTAQEYDVQVTAVDGSVLWTWSYGLVFAAAEHTRNLSDGWTVKLEIPKPTAEAYQVQAWLTTTGAPAHAATVPVIVTE